MTKVAKNKRSKRRTGNKPSKRRQLRAVSPAVGSEAVWNSAVENPVDQSPLPPSRVRVRIALLVLFCSIFVWAYWPTLTNLVDSWSIQPDYSHGFLVVPIALFFLWIRRDRMPRFSAELGLSGIFFIVLAGVLRWLSSYYFIEALDGWSIPLWIGGVVWLLAGRRMFWWAAPAIVFLFFMVPLPYVIENMLAGPLQAISTKVSCFILQCLHQPALSEGNTILIGEQRLEVQRACSGLRIFWGIFAMAYAMIVLFPRGWFVKSIVLLAALPIAVLANSIRIVVTGLLYQWGFEESLGVLIHDVAGWMMIPLAAFLFLCFMFFIDKLIPVTGSVHVGHVIKRDPHDAQTAI